MIKTKIKNSISLQLLRKVFIIYFSITLVITIAQIVIEYYETKNRIKTELISLEDTFKESIKDAVWDMNIAQAQSIALSIYKLPFVKEVVISDNSNNIINEYKNRENKSVFSHEFNIFNNYNGHTILIAHVKISSDNSSVIDRVKIGVILIFLNASIKSFILVILFIWAFKIYMIRPLNNFTNQIENINFENMDREKINVQVKEESEIYFLQNKFNEMIEKLNAQKTIILNIKNEYLTKLENEVKERTHALEMSNAELTRMASTDYLTNIRNRRSFYEFSQNFFTLAKRNSKELFILNMDLDYFKKINDTYGHQAGDEVLKQFAINTQKQLRESDIFGRVGGEEFSICIYDTSLDTAKKIAQRIINTIADIVISYEGKKIVFTVSMGIAAIKISDSNIDEIIQRADSALYKSKENGRNKFTIEL